ncbi:WXG100 family type VII secretion target [Nocardioides mangrovi]|uniref:ESAT-6-like protein n=1 Tax=Nocardioides mangrovi TaxID=2874580 RepID=A0ABS7UAG6_9ACTN|nr:WXG100 family type VII secretion target [Nocardioides mangrovi]MBZ5737637.1 WXG100 family type VII secretion target [Nocardioides mangrovi]
MYGVDTEELLGTVEDLRRCGAALDELLDEVARRVAALHVSWSGLAADAQVAAQAEWEAGFREMQAALGAMRAAADHAHGSYREAVDTNLRMWEQVS